MSREGGDLVQITDFEEPVSGAYLPTRDEIVLQMDDGGNERLQIYLLGSQGNDLTNVVYDPDYIHRLGGITRDGESIAYASNRRNGVDFDVFVRSLATDEERAVFEMGGWCEPVGFSPDGRYVAITRLTDKNADNDTYLVDLKTDEVVHISPHEDEAHFGPPQWLPDGSAFFFSTDNAREFRGIARYNMKEGSWDYVMEPKWDAGCLIDWPGQHLAVVLNQNGYARITLHDASSLQPVHEVELPGRGIARPRFSRDGAFMTLTYVSFVHPGDVWMYDIGDRSSKRLTHSPSPVPQEQFIDFDLGHFESFDGEEIPTFFARPRTFTGDKPPVVVIIHGGPEGQSAATFHPVAQYFLYRGYAVVIPNVRGSTGYGKRYHHLDDVRKRLDSVRDLEALHRWLPTAGLDSSRAVLMGGSYGGYMVLAGLAFQPELWAAGIDVVGISSLVTFLENTAPWRRKFREREYGSLENDRDFLTEVSPLTHVDRISAPLFIIHGRNDPRVPVGETEQMHKALLEKGIPTEMLIYEDEGHGLQKLKNRLNAYSKAVDFLDRVLAQ